MSAKIWYQPYGATELVGIDLGRPLSEAPESEDRDEAVSESFTGKRIKVVFRGTNVVRIRANLLTSQTTVRELEALVNHLRRGGVCTVAEDGSRTLGGFALVPPAPEYSTVQWASNLFDTTNGYAGYTVTSGDVLVLRGPGPELLQEEVVASAAFGTRGATLSVVPRNDWGIKAWTYIRLKGFWPVLRLQADATNDPGLLRTERRINWTLDLPLEEPPSAFDALIGVKVDGIYEGIEHATMDDLINTTGLFKPPFGGGGITMHNSPFGLNTGLGKWW